MALMNASPTESTHRTPSLSASRARYNRWRLIKDGIARHLIAFGGVSVIVFILLIFFYLAYVVIPLFQRADVTVGGQYTAPLTCTEPSHLALDELITVGAQFCGDGNATFFETTTGKTVAARRLIPQEATASGFAVGESKGGFYSYGLSDGRAVIAQNLYQVTFNNDQRQITPTIVFPYGEEPIAVANAPLTQLAFRHSEHEATLAAYTADKRLLLLHLAEARSFIDDEVTLEKNVYELPAIAHPVDYLLIDKSQFHLVAIARSGEASHFDITDKAHPKLIELTTLGQVGAQVTAATMLAGDISVLVGLSTGHIAQWTFVRQPDNIARLTSVRTFHSNRGAISAIAPEPARKGFYAADVTGTVVIYHSTAERTLYEHSVSSTPISAVAVAPRADAMLTLDDKGQLQFANVRNEHPEVSWSSLWGKVWYENYQEPAYLWQSSAATDDFEPKFSLTPITFGTIKAAFYAMLLAVPISLMAALYTAQFMAPKMRSWVKPLIEIMEALPTVVLGFLAGLWLAPLVERHLPGVFTMLLVLPIGILLTAYAWSRVPSALRTRIPDGWEAALLLPTVCVLIWGSFALSPVIETHMLGGDTRLWLKQEMGWSFDQRNAIVVGLAMGFAIIPTIFSIAEDAVFGVPKHLIQGSLALGATPWQTMIRVVMLTASPGIFSAIMIGLGRAVGETMIVLMATGNTAVMSFSAFLGLRTLSANVAVELPESEVGSTHFRVLFLAGLVLFIFTFFVNTVAEIVRQRLRRKYSSL